YSPRISGLGKNVKISLVTCLGGVIGAVVTMVVCYSDNSWLRFTPAAMTEGFSMLAVVLVIYSVSLLLEKKQIALVVLNGLIAGLLILVRSMFIFWIPGLLALVMLCWQWGGKGKQLQTV